MPCIAVNHDAVDCFAADFRPSQWCPECLERFNYEPEGGWCCQCGEAGHTDEDPHDAVYRRARAEAQARDLAQRSVARYGPLDPEGPGMTVDVP